MTTPVDPVIPNAARFTTFLTTGAYRVQNVWGISLPPGATVGGAQAAGFGAVYWQQFHTIYGTGVTFTDCTLRDLRQSPSLIYDGGTVASNTGTASGIQASPQVCALVRLGTATPTRRGRGRTYISPILDGSLDAYGAVLTTGAQANFAAAVNNFSQQLAQVIPGSQLAVISSVDRVARPVISYVCEPLVGSQRRRTRR